MYESPEVETQKETSKMRSQVWGVGGGAHKMTKITNFSFSGPIGMKIGQRCGFLPEIKHTQFQLSSLNG